MNLLAKYGTLVAFAALLLLLCGPRPTHAQNPAVGQIGTTAQQSVTGTAAALASMPTTMLCMKALPSNTITIYWSTLSNVSTTTGFPLAASETSCVPVVNSNLIYVVASTTGAKIAWFNTSQ